MAPVTAHHTFRDDTIVALPNGSVVVLDRTGQRIGPAFPTFAQANTWVLDGAPGA